MLITVDNLGMLKDLFSYDGIQQLQASVTLMGLKEELSEDHLALTSEDVAFSETGTLTDFTIPESTWDGIWADIEYGLLNGKCQRSAVLRKSHYFSKLMLAKSNYIC